MINEEKLRGEWKNKLQTEWGQDNRDSESFDDWSANQLIEKIKQSNLALLEEVEKQKLASNIALMKLLLKSGKKGDMERLVEEFTIKLSTLSKHKERLSK